MVQNFRSDDYDLTNKESGRPKTQLDNETLIELAEARQSQNLQAPSPPQKKKVICIKVYTYM